MNEHELLPCPFCGGEAVQTMRTGRRGPFAYCRCEICGAQTRIVTVNGDPDGDVDFWNQDSIRKVERLWNNRTILDESGAEL